MYNDRVQFEIGNEMQSCTECPSFYPVEDSQGRAVWLVDAPGFGDSNPDKEYANMSSLQHILRNAREVNIWTLATHVSTSGQRGAKFLNFVTSAVRAINKESLNHLKTLVVPLMSKSPNSRSTTIKAVEKGMRAVEEVIIKKQAIVGKDDSELTNE